jgi:hypothetical protein
MKKKIITLLVFCLLGVIPICSVAQAYKSFDLSTYYTPDIVRNQLDLSGASSGLFNNSMDYVDRNNFSGGLNATFANYMNTRKMIRTISGGLGLSVNNSDYKSSSLNSKSNSFTHFDFVDVNYQIFNTKRQFLRVGANLGANYGSNFGSSTANNNNNVIQSDSTKIRAFQAGCRLYVGVGVGRIEVVTEAQQAVYLMDAFTKNNVLAGELSHDEIFKLAQEMSRTKNKRFLDARLHLMDEISHVDSFFVSNNLITKQDARYFTNLYDVWLYGDAFERKSGHSIEVQLIPDFHFSSNSSNNSYLVSTTSNFNLAAHEYKLNNTLSVFYQLEKPVNQRWQHSAFVRLNGLLGFENYDYNYKSAGISDNKSGTDKNVELATSYKLGFYPNTRTNIYAQISQNFYRKFSGLVNDYNFSFFSDNISFLSSTGLSLGIYYYISPQLQFSASGSFKTYHNATNLSNINTRKNFSDGQFLLGFNYSFF